MRLSGSQSKPSLSKIQVAVTLVLIVAANINSATCNDAHFLPESHFLKQFTPSDCWGHEVDCPKAAAHVDCSEAIDTSFHPADAKRAHQVFFTQGDFGYLGEFVSSLRNYCRPETQFDSSLTCTANLQFCSGVKSSGASNITWYHISDHSVLPNYFLLIDVARLIWNGPKDRIRCCFDETSWGRYTVNSCLNSFHQNNTRFCLSAHSISISTDGMFLLCFLPREHQL